MVNESILPNPFKADAGERDRHLESVLHAVERDLAERTEALPAFLDDAFLARLEAEIVGASPPCYNSGQRVVAALRSRLSDQT